MPEVTRFSLEGLPTGDAMVDVIDSRVAKRASRLWRAFVTFATTTGVRVRRPQEQQADALIYPVLGNAPSVGDDVLMLTDEAGGTYCLGKVGGGGFKRVTVTEIVGASAMPNPLHDGPFMGGALGILTGAVIGTEGESTNEVTVYCQGMATFPVPGDVIIATAESISGNLVGVGIVDPAFPMMVYLLGSSVVSVPNTGSPVYAYCGSLPSPFTSAGIPPGCWMARLDYQMWPTGTVVPTAPNYTQGLTVGLTMRSSTATLAAYPPSANSLLDRFGFATNKLEVYQGAQPGSLFTNFVKFYSEGGPTEEPWEFYLSGTSQNPAPRATYDLRCTGGVLIRAGWPVIGTGLP